LAFKNTEKENDSPNFSDELEKIARMQDKLILRKAEITSEELEFLTCKMYELDELTIKQMRSKYIADEITAKEFAEQITAKLVSLYGGESTEIKQEADEFYDHSLESMEKLFKPKGMSSEEFRRKVKLKKMTPEEFEQFKKETQGMKDVFSTGIFSWRSWVTFFIIFSVLPRLLLAKDPVVNSDEEIVQQIGPLTIVKKKEEKRGEEWSD
jgi:hypothetical protein